MCLRKSPARTPAFLAANCRNAQKCTGPRTSAGKARSSLNALKSGDYARRLPEKLLAAGQNEGAALYARIREEIIVAFRIADPTNLVRVERWANAVYALARQAGVVGTKPECPLFSVTLGPRSCSYSRFRISDPCSRLGMVYWVQRKGFWNQKKLFTAMLDNAPAEEPPWRQTLEHGLRHRVFRLRRPSLWERTNFDWRSAFDD